MSSRNVRAFAPPPQEGIDGQYARGLAEGAFMVQVCAGCKAVRWPPTARCARCLAAEHTWAAASGRGRLWSWTVMHRSYFPGAEEQLPYAIGYIRLDEGPMVMARLRTATGARCDAEVALLADESRDAGIAVFGLID